jgi:cyclophilin family peptidyl-prolyl cis-trans isomerase
VPKQRKKEQQHLRQTPARRKGYTMGGQEPSAIYKPGFPMNLLGNLKVFSIVGVVVGAVMVVGAVLGSRNNTDRSALDPLTPTPTATASATPDPNATPDPSATASTAQTAAAAATPRKQFSQAEQVVDAEKKSYTATIKTDKGDIELKLFAAESPKTVNNFVFLAQQKYFDGIKFHRVVPDFVVQGGDPTGTGTGGPGYETEEDANEMKNTRGRVSMAKAGAVTKFGSQFFINLKDNPALDLDTAAQKRFYPFAEVTSGMDVVAKLAQNDIIRSITITETAR